MPPHRSADRPRPHLDPRRPLVLDTRDLPRRPGSLRVLRRVVPAPPDLGVEVIRVPAGADVALDLRLESVMEGVLVSGTATAPTVGECARCLDPLAGAVAVDLQELYAYPGHAEPGTGDDEALPELDGDLLDLEPALRDAVVLALPLAPLCAEDCAGLCVDCGVRLADAEPGHGHATLDPRWAALSPLALPSHDLPEE